MVNLLQQLEYPQHSERYAILIVAQLNLLDIEDSRALASLLLVVWGAFLYDTCAN